MALLKKTLAACFAGTLAVSNVVASKIAMFNLPLVGDVTAPAGFVGIAIAFLFTDLIGEFYGKAEAREVVNATIVALLAAYGVVYSAVMMPAAPFYEHAEAFNSIMGMGGMIVVASILTLLVSQNIDVSVFHWVKEKTGVRAARNIGSTAVSQAVDTTLFIGLAFVVLPLLVSGSGMALGAAASLAVAQYAAKLGVALAETPVFYAVTEFVDG